MQKKMFDLVLNKKYVADPIKGSKHNRGVAVDVSLANSKNQALDMGTEFDDFTEEAHYANAAFESDTRENRIILRKLMIAAGFVPYDNEWWHFNYKNTNYPFSNFEWQCP
jgi:zinc D-Ala-D-Ala dipeptidase